MFTVAAAFILGFMYFLVADLRRAQRGLSSKNIFRSYSSDRLLFNSYKFNFFVFLFPRGVRGELEKEKLLIKYQNSCQSLL